MACLLATVAFLQYRWANEASSADEMRTDAKLESLMMKWQSDLYREFSTICIAVQVGPDLGARDTWNDYLERYIAWNDALPHESLPYIYRNPDFVGEIYIWETSRRSKPQLFWLSLDKKRIERSSVPKDFEPLLARLQANSASLSMALRAWRLPDRPLEPDAQAYSASEATSPWSETTKGWIFDSRIPAMIHPIFHRGNSKSLSSDSPLDWIVITMDMSVLQKRYLPELATRYFGGLDGLDYKVAVIATGFTPRIIYTSDPGFGDLDLETTDSTFNIFGPPSAKLGDPVRQNLMRRSEWHSLFKVPWFPVIEYDSQPDSWVLELQHRGGPLQSVLNRARQKNLALSAFVLLLLAVSIGVLTIAGIRAHNFARLQMDFVASISHELRTPLAAIFSAGENIKDGVVSEKSSLANYGSMIISQSRQLMSHVDRILIDNAGRIVYENVDSTKVRDGFIEKPNNFRHASDIGLDGKRLAAGGLNFGHEFLRRVCLGDIIHRHGGSVPAEALGNGAPDAARRAGDQRDFSFQFVVHLVEDIAKVQRWQNFWKF